MEAKSDRFEVFSGGVDEKGQHLEPEEQLVQRVIDVDAPTNMQGSTRQVGTIPTQIIAQSTVGDLGITLRGMCGDCKYFDQKRWLADLERADSPLAPIEFRQQVQALRYEIYSTNSPTLADQAVDATGELDPDVALRQSGYCHALYSYFRNLGESREDASVICHSSSSCPKFVRTATEPAGFFEPRDNDAVRLGAKKYDQIMRLASSLKPK